MSAGRLAAGWLAAVLALGTPERALADAGTPAPAEETSPARAADDGNAPIDATRDENCADERPPRSFGSSAAGTAMALVPGLVVHGAGHLTVGETKTGLRLLALEGTGLGVLAAGFLPIVLTGASRRLIGPAAALTAAGVGLFAISFLADIYGVVAPAGGTGAPLRETPMLQTALGYRYVYDPTFSYRHFMAQEIDYRTGSWRLHPTAWFAFDDTNARLRAHVAYRVAGPLPRGKPLSRDGSFIDVEGAITRHAFTSNRFSTTTFEVAVAGRLDMVRIGPSLRGSFAEMSAGMATQAYSYDVRDATADVGELLLLRFGFGMYLGFPGTPQGEITVFYDHRHDDFAAGLKLTGLGSGVAGHFGADARLFLTRQWGVAAEAAVGSSYLTGLSILFRHWGPR